MAVFWKEAAKSDFCWSVRRFLSSWEGKEMGLLTDFWTSRSTAVLRPEKEKSRPATLGWGRRYLFSSPFLAVLEIEGPPG